MAKLILISVNMGIALVCLMAGWEVAGTLAGSVAGFVMVQK